MSAKYKVELNRALSIDFELTCWEPGEGDNKTPEIIQIGIAELNLKTLKRTRSDSWYVKNEFGNISEYCTSITGITQDLLNKKGFKLQDAARLVSRKYGTKNKSWFSWGSDKRAHDEDCIKKSVDPFLSNAFVDASLLYSQICGASTSTSLKDIADHFDVQFEGQAHDAKIDAEVLCDVWSQLISCFRHQGLNF